MPAIDIGPFRLVDPPDGQEEIITAAIRAIDFPWDLLSARIHEDYDGAIVVEWGGTGQNVSGLYYGGPNKIVMSTRQYHLDVGAGFVFAHEVGHLVDDWFLDDTARKQLATVMHATPGRYDGQQMNGAEHGWSHNQPHSEAWVSGNDYLFRHNEAFADLFVATFAPTVWDGSYLPEGSARYPRFVHWTEDHEVVKEIVLRAATPPEPTPTPEPVRKPMFKDVPLSHPKNEAIEKAVSLGLLKPRRRGIFRPSAKLTRAEAAELAVALYKARNKR